MATEETEARDEASAENPEELSNLRRGEPAQSAAGLPAVTHSFRHALRESSMGRAAASWFALNQKDGFDCPSCAWPDPDDHRAKTEFCENGAKAVASEASNRKRCDADFFRKWSVEELAAKPDHWHELQGRLTEPVVLRRGAAHYEPISWEDAFHMVGDELKALDSLVMPLHALLPSVQDQEISSRNRGHVDPIRHWRESTQTSPHCSRPQIPIEDRA